MKTLKEFSEQVLRPRALQAVRNGEVDGAIQLREVREFYVDDDEMLQAIKDRLKILSEQTISPTSTPE